MRIDFPDKGYILVESKDDKIIISIGAASQDNQFSMVINTVELSKEEFNKLITNIK